MDKRKFDEWTFLLDIPTPDGQNRARTEKEVARMAELEAELYPATSDPAACTCSGYLHVDGCPNDSEFWDGDPLDCASIPTPGAVEEREGEHLARYGY